MQGLPTGTVTFLFTDLAGSTRLWEDFPDAMRPALARHDEILREAIAAHGGHVVKTTGDGFHAAFATAASAADAAATAQRALATEPWPDTGPLRVRMGLHTGTGELRDGDYYGTSLNRAARVMAIAHGGQIVCSHATEELLHDQLADGLGLADLGEHGLRDLARPERVFQVVVPGLEEVFPPLRSLDAFPGNLPLQATSFVGRDEEVADAAELLDRARLVTLTGVGGVGKTRLALQVAAEVLPRFADGAWVSELAAATADGLDFDALAHSDAVVLFAERARAARAGFRLDEGNAAAVAEVCRRLDGIPLALELAAARVASMNPSDIAQRIDERFRLLTGGRRVGIERHQTLRATVDWSYSLLEPAEQLVFDRLSVFSGGFDATAAERVVSGDGVEDWDVLDALGSLVLKSMVLIDETADGDARYQMLETLRAYARERLDERDETDRWRRAHAAYFADRAELLGEQVLGPDEFAWRGRLRTDLDNLRIAVTWALDSEAQTDHQLGIRVIAALGYEVTMDRSAGYGEWAERAMAVLDTATPGQRSGVLGVAAFAHQHRGELAGTRRLGEAAIADGVAESRTPNLPFIALATVELVGGSPGAAADLMASVRRRATELGLRPFEVVNCQSVEAMYRALGSDETAALPSAHEAVSASRALGNPSQLAIALYAYGTAARSSDPEAALAAFNESVVLTRQGSSDVLLASSLVFIAELRADQGDHGAALARLRESLRHCLDCGNRSGLWGSLEIAATVLAKLGRDQLAARCEAIAAVGG